MITRRAGSQTLARCSFERRRADRSRIAERSALIYAEGGI